MTKIQLLNAKGTRDFLPEEKIIRNNIEKAIKELFEIYGFSPVETPVLERYDILASKYAGGSEILKETFRLIDQGKRELGLRYDMTVPLCRLIGMNPSIKFPFKCYQIGTVYRDGPVASERLRVFTQCDADIIGAKAMAADAECIMLAESVFKKLKIDVVIEVNNRKLLDGILEDIGVPSNKWTDCILIIDKMKKISQQQLEKELDDIGITKRQIKMLFTLIGKENDKFSNEEKIKRFRKRLKSRNSKEGLEELQQIFASLPKKENKKEKKNILFTPSLARGLAYYTGTVFEVFAVHENTTASIGGGGRYNKMIQQFLEREQEYPAVGISFGLDRIYLIFKEIMEKKNAKNQAEKQEKQKTVTELFVVPINTEKECIDIVQRLRNAGIKTETDIIGRGPSKNLQYANSQAIPYVLFIGQEELKKKLFKLKEMQSGKEISGDIDTIIETIKTSLQRILKKTKFS